MRRAVLLLLGVAGFASAQVTMKQLMLDLIHPAANDLLLIVNRGEPKGDAEWATVRRSAVTLSESGNLLMARGRDRNQTDWARDAKMLSDVGTAAYKAAEARDAGALAALTAPLDASCTTCHKQYRPDVFPSAKGSK
jgi:cytochrome c556